MTERRAAILFKDRIAGSLEETASGGTRFTYANDWQDPIGCCFPVSRREHEWTSGLHPFFEHLGTEGWLREQQARHAHVAEEDDFGLLLRYGGDCIGAVSVRAPDGACSPLSETVVPAISPGRTVSGVQKKLLVVRDADGRFVPAGAEGPAPFIAKFNSESVPTLVRNELLSLRWAAAVLGQREVNAFEAAEVHGVGEHALIVTRFDREADGSKLRLEDFAQILSKPRGRDYAGKYDAGYEDVARVITEHSARPDIDRGKFFRRLIVFALVGNCDAHLKNFSLLETRQGLRLSPLYDVLNTALYDGFDRDLALTVAGRRVHLDAVTRESLTAFGLSIGLPRRAVDQAFADIGRRVRAPVAAGLLVPPGGEPPDGFIHRFAEIVEGACLRILP
ncbi:MAG: HipA domain-containing protein [Proteobacteria bacterium]|nr:HipA domain-containing protein [Pseudomonadota bacterium]